MQLFAITTRGIYKYATRARWLRSCDDCQVRVLSLSILASHAENKRGAKQRMITERFP